MKKRILVITSLILIITIVIININNKDKSLNNLTIKSYLDGELLAALPTSNDNLKVSSVTCTNGTGKFNYSSWRLEVSTTSKTICTINFTSNTNTNFNTYLKSKLCGSSVTDEAGAKDCLVNENGYRYEGSNPNNYVLFNDELWRIIGVFDIKPSGSSTTQSLVKLIRNETLDSLAWNTSSSSNTWSSASLQSSLNNGYLNATDETCNTFSTSVTKTCKFSESGIKSGARSKIQAVQWNVGKTTAGTAATMYSAETGTTWSGSVGLISASDYGYATFASTGCPRTTSTESYSKTDCAGKNWLYKDGYQWTITGSSSNSSYALYVFNNGNVSSTLVYSGDGVRPSIYLKSNTKYMNGSGTYSDPYIIS